MRRTVKVILQTKKGEQPLVRRKVSPGMAAVADRAIKKYNVPMDRIDDDKFYLVNHLTGQPVVRK